MLIAICGIDGSGKSTMVGFLLNLFKNENIYAINPMLTGKLINELKDLKGPIGISNGSLNSIVYAMEMLHCLNNIKMNIEKSIVISHRYDICCETYAEMAGADLDYVKLITQSLPQADMYIYLDIHPKKAYSRLLKRNQKINVFTSSFNCLLF